MKFAILNAFIDKPMSGNPAAVCLLDSWLPDSTLLIIAKQFGYSETAFIVDADPIELRWFTPKNEVDLCGHATMASAHFLFESRPKSNAIKFKTLSGLLTVKRESEQLAMDFPTRKLSQFNDLDILSQCLNAQVIEAAAAESTVLAVMRDQASVATIDPDYSKISALPFNALIPTAIGESVDFVSRVFAPAIGIPEDPVTGAAHTGLAPFWAGKLGKKKLSAKQLSRRGGKLNCELVGDRVILTGRTEQFAEGEFFLSK